MECRKQKFSFSEPIYLLFTFVLFNRNSHCKSRCYEQSEFDSAASNLVQSANWKGNYDDGVMRSTVSRMTYNPWNTYYKPAVSFENRGIINYFPVLKQGY